jgi:hypothetical protein
MAERGAAVAAFRLAGGAPEEAACARKCVRACARAGVCARTELSERASVDRRGSASAPPDEAGVSALAPNGSAPASPTLASATLTGCHPV